MCVCRGKFAVVKKCVEKTTGKEHAAKFLRKRRKGQDCRGDILHEIAVLESAEANPYVVALHEVYETPSEIILVLEWYETTHTHTHICEDLYTNMIWLQCAQFYFKWQAL